MSAWRADPAVTAAVVNGVWRDPDIDEGASVTTPQAAGALPELHKQAAAALDAMTDLRDAELVGPPGIGRQTLAAQHAARRGAPLDGG